MYPLVVDDGVYASLIQNAYDAARWMRERRVREEAIRIDRSKKKLQELCRKGAIQIKDTLTMRKKGRDGSVVAFSATIKALDPHCIPIMETTGDLTKTRWPMVGPNDFDREMVRNHSSLRVSSRGTWDTVSVRRNGQDLGSLYLIRQCLQLWEMEIEKWGCNGLGEELGDSI